LRRGRVFLLPLIRGGLRRGRIQTPTRPPPYQGGGEKIQTPTRPPLIKGEEKKFRPLPNLSRNSGEENKIQ